MTAFNVVRFRTRPGMENAFIEAHERASFEVTGFRRGALVKTGDRTFCFIGEWDNMDSLTAARPAMIATLDSFRSLLEDLGGGLGVSDPVSGPVVADLSG
jgi:hypothetical protein